MKRIKKGLLSIIGILIIILLGVLFNYMFRNQEETTKKLFEFPSSFNCTNEDISNKCVIKKDNIEATIYAQDISVSNNNVLVQLLVKINNKEINELKVSKYASQLAGAYISNDLFVLGFNENSSECDINLFVYNKDGNRIDYNQNEYKVCKIIDNRLELKDTFSCNNGINNDKIVKKNIELQYVNNTLNEMIIDSSNNCNIEGE